MKFVHREHGDGAAHVIVLYIQNTTHTQIEIDDEIGCDWSGWF